MVRTSVTRLSVVFLIAHVCALAWSQAETTVISGRVINSLGRPVANATVSLYSPTRSSDQQSVDQIIPSFETGLDGKFRFSVSLAANNQQLLLYVTTRLPANADAPLRPPFLDLKGSNLLPGKPVQVEGRRDIDVGDVPVAIYYRPIVIHLRKASGVKALQTRDDGLPWLRVRDRHGDVVAWEMVRKSALNLDESAITIALPQGIWNVEISLQGRDGPWSSLVKPIQVEPNVEAAGLSLTLFTDRREKANRTDRNAINSVRAEQARERLVALGIQYDADSFVEHAGKCNNEGVRLFLATGLNPNVTGSMRTTALVLASARGCSDVAKSLLEAGADPNLSNDAGTSPLIAAATSGSLSTVEALLARRANPNVKDKEGLTPLTIAAGNSDLRILNALLRANADVNTRDNSNRTALDYAIEAGDRGVVAALKSAGAQRGKQ
ncbi:MAG TPA: ankyrin repeat domain-containing protein [Pyrinomonadaceae bacterium]|nr:ankyrin repeat domain-containing protein [Pyrinomonadaceae bacterium]